jgi:hypothetical protein
MKQETNRNQNVRKHIESSSRSVMTTARAHVCGDAE